MNVNDKVRYIDVPRFVDDRGYFQETLNLDKSQFQLGKYVQSNMSMNKKDVFRGLHYQLKNPQGKLVQVLHGSVFDFVIDLRQNSDTYLRFDVFYLSGKREIALWVPPGYAHGFISNEDNTIFQYHVFENGRVVGDEYCINPYSIYHISNMLETYAKQGSQITIAQKDLLGCKLEDAPKYE
jgi:dTDP-4-dehydrorhamnose 3,5-epimerase